MEKLGELIVTLRKEKGLRQVELAEEANISKSYLSLIEAGKRMPELNTLRRISNALKTPIEVLIFKGFSENSSLDILLDLLDSVKEDYNLEPDKKKIIEEIKPILERLIKKLLETPIKNPSHRLAPSRTAV